MQERRIILGAFGISLLLHIVLLVTTWRIPFLQVDLSQAQPADQEIELFLVPEETAAAGDAPVDPREIRRFANVPDRDATELAPENPQYLAMHHSIAADNVIGGDGDTPSAALESEMEAVAIRKEELGGQPGVEFDQQPLVAPQTGEASAAAGADGRMERDARGQAAGPRGEWVVPEDETAKGPDREGQRQEKSEQPDLAEWWSGQAPTVLREGEQGGSGDRGYDFNQMSSGSVSSGVAIDGDFSLNTYEWDYAPWMKRFGNQLHRVWMAPYAYRVGIISGKTVIRVVVEKNGVPSSMEVLETDGHASLHEASVAALKAFAPYAPLPAGFPEDRLVITMILLYPAWKR